MRVLVTGGSCLLGWNLLRSEPNGADVAYTWWTTKQPWCHHQMDVCDRSQVSYVFGRVRPQVVVHMASAGDVDWCQANYREAWRINVEGTENVLEAAGLSGARVLYTSSNAVYGGDDPPYAEGSPREPVNAYGKMRRKAEDLVMGYNREWLIARLFLLYGQEPQGARGNWGTKALRWLEAGRSLRIVDDVVYQPTWAADAARAVWRLALDGEPGCWNVAGDGACTLHGFVTALAEAWGFPPEMVGRAEFGEFPELTPRPLDSRYDLSKSKNWGICPRGYLEGVEAFRDERA